MDRARLPPPNSDALSAEGVTRMSEVWTVQFTMNGLPDEGTRTGLQIRLDDANVGASVSAIRPYNQWVLSFAVEAPSRGAALYEAESLAARMRIAMDPVAVEILSTDELDRRADEPNMPQLVGTSEVAAMLRVTRRRVNQLRRHAAFPAPLVEVATGPLWDARAIDKFALEWTPTRGRPGITATLTGLAPGRRTQIARRRPTSGGLASAGLTTVRKAGTQSRS